MNGPSAHIDSSRTRALSLAEAALLAVSLGVMAIAVSLVPYARPVWDDFCAAAFCFPVADRPGVEQQCFPDLLTYVREAYVTYTGRWSAVLLESRAISSVGILSRYWLLLAGVWSLVLLAVWRAVSSVLGDEAGQARVLAASTVLFAVLWSGTPSPGQSFYWFVGSFEYLLPVALFVALYWMITAATQAPSGARRVAFLLPIFAVAGFTAGLNELVTLALGTLLAVGAWLTSWSRRRPGLPWITALVGATMGGLAVVAAPGNARRAGWQSGSGDLVRSLYLTVSQIVTEVIPWLLDPKILASSVILLTSGWFLTARQRTGPLSSRQALLLPGVLMVLVAGFLFTIAWFKGDPSPGRVMNLAYACIVVGGFVSLYLCSGGLATRVDTDSQFVRGARVAATLVLAVALATSQNTVQGVRDLSGAGGAATWSRSMADRYRTIEEAVDDGRRALSVPPVASWPGLYFGRDLLPDSSDWYNQCFATYFGIDSVHLRLP